MSYILDALRRADAERERDPARGIHAQPAAGVPARRRSPLPGWAWPAGALVIVAAAGVLAWTRFTMTDEAPAHLAAPTSSAADVVPVAATVPVAPVMPVAPPVPVAAAVLPPPPVIVERVRVVAAPAANAPVAKASVPAQAPA